MNVRYIIDLETMVCGSDKSKCQQTRMKCKSVEGWNKWVLYRIKVDDVLRPQCDYSYCDRINISNQRIRLHTSARVRRFFVSHRIMLSKLPTDVLHWHAGLQVDMNPTATQQHHMDGHWNWMSALSTPQRSNVAVSKVTDRVLTCVWKKVTSTTVLWHCWATCWNGSDSCRMEI